MATAFKQFKTRALSRPGVRKAYGALDDEFAFLDEVLKARAVLATLQRYARALGYWLEVRLVKSRVRRVRSRRSADKAGRR